MVALRPFRFSSPLGRIVDGPGLRERARKLEDLGFSTLTISDHFDLQLGPVAALMAAADATTTLRVASLVFSNDYRHPAVLAKEAATLDLLTDGRFEFGLGAGWMDADYQQAGIAHDSAKVRVDRMEESLDVIRALWLDEPTTHHGNHYDIDRLDGTPKPLTTGGPPIIIGGGGKRVMQLAARVADIVGFNPNMKAGKIDENAGQSATPEATDRKMGWIREAAGDRFDSLELQIRLELAIVTDDPDPMYEVLAGGFGMSPADARVTPHACVGTIDEICESLIARRAQWGFNYIGVPAVSVDEFAPVVARLAGT